MKLYRIKDWSSLYETHETRKLAALRWVPIPNKHDGLTFRQISQEKNGAELFTAWVLMLQLASKGDRDHRGQLVSGGRPLTPKNMALITGFPEAIFTRALAYFTQEHVGWIVAEQSNFELPLSPGEPGGAAGEPGSDAARTPPNGMEGKGRNGRDQLGRPAAPDRPRDVLFDALAIAEGSDPKQLTKSAAKTIGVALAEIRKASPNVMPSDIQARAQRYRKVMPQGSTLTASALAKHWARCGAPVAFEKPQPEPPPENWKIALLKLYPEARPDIEWRDVPDDIQAKVRAYKFNP